MTTHNMPTQRSILALCVILSWVSASVSAQEPAPTPSTKIKAGAPLHAFGGRPLVFDLVVQAPLGTHATIYADLVQTANGTIAATLQRDVSISAELVFDGCTSMEVPCHLPALDAVKRITSMRLWLRTDPPGTRTSQGLVLLLTVYPVEEPDAWKKMLATRSSHTGLYRLAVFGEAKGARQFLRSRNVSFEDLGSDWPTDPEPGTLYVADLPTAPVPRRTDATRGTRWLIFTTTEATPLPPGVYQRMEVDGGEVCKVTIPDLFNDPDDHPDRLATLAEIFRIVLEPRPLSSAESQP